MRIVNLNPDTGIGASAWFVDIEGNRILLDAGTHPKRDGRESLPLYSTIAKEELDAIAITHCHHDHVGSLPVALRHFPKAHVLMSELSYFIIERVLHNSVNVMTRQRDEMGIKEYPLYTHDEVEEIAARFQAFKYNREVEWASYNKTRSGFLSPTLEFHDAGHALGSAGVMIRADKQSIFYTGDVCFHDQTILRSARFEDVKADVLIMETTRGNRQVPAGFTRAAEAERLAQAIQRVLERKGSVLIPTFALGRTQEILAQLALMMQAGKLKSQPVFIGGLGRVFTQIYDLESHRISRQHQNLKLSQALNLVVPERNQTEQMRLGGGKLFVITAGMMTEQTPAHELALRMVE
ncbi:MAG: MBL fold metallo-hydrolase, partial [Verrucomicrobiota bacterium]